MDKQKLIILEGTDAVGKSAIKKALEKSSNWKYIILDRFAGSDFVYDKLYKRKNRDSILLKLESDLNEIADVHLIYLNCDSEEQSRRLNIKKEDKDIIKRINLSKDLFQEYLNNTYLEFLELSTSKYNIKQCVELITEFVEKDHE